MAKGGGTLVGNILETQVWPRFEHTAWRFAAQSPNQCATGVPCVHPKDTTICQIVVTNLNGFGYLLQYVEVTWSQENLNTFRAE